METTEIRDHDEMSPELRPVPAATLDVANEDTGTNVPLEAPLGDELVPLPEAPDVPAVGGGGDVPVEPPDGREEGLSGDGHYRYEDYMKYEVTYPNPWTAETFSDDLQTLGATQPEVTQEEADGLRDCYRGSFRSYHGEDHGTFVGQDQVPNPLAAQLEYFTVEEAGAHLRGSGKAHDKVYMQVDAMRDGEATGAWAPAVVELIGDAAHPAETIDPETGRSTFTVYVNENPDPVTEMVCHMFGGVGPEGIAHTAGANEFASALAWAKFLEQHGATMEHMTVDTTLIAATIPFRDSLGDDNGEITDGHMGELADRLWTAPGLSDPIDDPVATARNNDIMRLAVNLANRDIAPFVQPDGAGAVVDNGRKVRQEELPEGRIPARNTRELDRLANMDQSSGVLYRAFAGEVEIGLKVINVPHLFIPRDTQGQRLGIGASYPPRPVHQQAAEHAEENSRQASLALSAHGVAIAGIASAAVLCGEPNGEAPVPGFVHSESWRPEALPHQPAALSPSDTKVLAMLRDGMDQHRLGPAVPSRSPAAGLIFGAIGRDGVARLSARIQDIRREARAEGIRDPFCDERYARPFFNDLATEIGPENLATLVGELQHVARTYAHDEDRARRLGRLLAEAT